MVGTGPVASPSAPGICLLQPCLVDAAPRDAVRVHRTGSPGGPSQLTVVVDDGAGGTSTWSLTCDPTGGDHPDAEQACAAIEGHRSALNPVPKDRMCAQVYGGPEKATVTGTWRGRGDLRRPLADERLRDRPLGRAGAAGAVRRPVADGDPPSGIGPPTHRVAIPRGRRSAIRRRPAQVATDLARGLSASSQPSSAAISSATPAAASAPPSQVSIAIRVRRASTSRSCVAPSCRDSEPDLDGEIVREHPAAVGPAPVAARSPRSARRPRIRTGGAGAPAPRRALPPGGPADAAGSTGR